jgi:hypothetical protein
MRMGHTPKRQGLKSRFDQLRKYYIKLDSVLIS